MTIIKTNKDRNLFPLSNLTNLWGRNPFQNFLNYDTLLNDDFFERDSLLPAMNMIEHEDDFEIEFAAPGFKKNDFKMTIDENILHVNGEKKMESEEKDTDYYHKEFNYTSFRRSLRLPDNVDIDKDLKATYKNGILRLKLMKLKEVKKETEKLIEIE